MSMSVRADEVDAAAPTSSERHPAFQSGSSDHVVHLYETEEELLRVMVDFLTQAPGADQPLLIVARDDRLRKISAALADSGLAVDEERRKGRIQLLEARDILGRIMMGESPDWARFRAVVGDALRSLSAKSPGSVVRVYGEMVDVLWSEGQKRAAIQLEEMWNELKHDHRFTLLCGYAMSGFDRESDIRAVCAEHVDSVAPEPEPHSGRITAGDIRAPRFTAAELVHRANVERILRDSLRELRRTESELRERQRETGRIVKITAAIADAVTSDQVYEAIVDLAGSAIGASAAALWLCDENTSRVHLQRAFGYSESSLARFGSFTSDDPVRFPALDAIARSEPIFLGSKEALLAAYPHLARDIGRGSTYGVACMPIVVDGRTLGGLAFTFQDAPPIDEDQRRFLTLAARYSAQAIERLRLLERERQRRSFAEASAARMIIFNHASQTFAESSSDVSALLAAVAEQISLETASGCAVALLADVDVARRFAAYPGGDELDALAEVLSEGAELPAERDASAHALVSLKVRGRRIGVICATRDPRQSFTEDEYELITELSERAALAIERALLHEAGGRARERAELLYGLARVVISAESVDQVVEAALDAIEAAVGAKRSAVLISDGDGVMRFRASRGLSNEYRALVEGHSPWPRDARAPEPVQIPDARNASALAALLPAIEAEGIRALAFIPLVAEARLIGKFMVYYDHPHELCPQELELAGAVANHVASAIARLNAVAELRETVRFNEMFTAILGHDLRNPLGAIMTAAQLVMMRYDDERMRRPLSRILNSGQRMARMIDQLLDFTRLRVGAGLPLSPVKLDVVPVLRQIIDELEVTNPGCPLSLEAVGDTVGEWDADRLAQVFSNVVGNAVQHGTREAGARVHVDGTDPQVLGVEIVNEGSIPADLVAKLFDPMMGGDARRDRSHGLGLGLFITRQIVRAHGGTIGVRSNEAEGTAFRIVLPRLSIRPAGAG
jgi:K+-sensing histidine kinase KdpD